MKRPLIFILVLICFVTAKSQSTFSDTSIVLNQVTVTDQEDPAKLLIRDLRKNYRVLKERIPQSVKMYTRQFNEEKETSFEQVSTVFFNNQGPYQEVEAFKDYRAVQGDFGNSVQVGAQFSLKPEFDFNANQSKGDFGRFPMAAFSATHWSPLSRKELTPHRVETLAGLLSPNCFAVYTFSIDKEYFFDGNGYATLSVQPKGALDGWEGTMEVNTTLNRVVSLNMKFQDLSCDIDFSTGSQWYVDHFNYSWKLGQQTVEQHTVAINVEKSIEGKESKMLVASLPERQERQPEFWESYRPSSPELDSWTKKQDSLIKYLNSDEYLDSADAVYNQFKWYEPLVSGIGYRKRSKGTNFFYTPLIGQWNFVGIGGTRWMPTVLGSKRFSDYTSLSGTANVNYGFLNKDLKGSVDLNYVYAPLHNGSVNVTFGDEYDQITQSVDLAGVFARSNFIRKTFAETYHRYEWFNGFYTRLGLEYSRRESIEGLQFAEWTNDLFGARNEPEPFDTYTVAQIGLEVLIRPYQRYYLKGRQKIVLSSKWPDFRFVLKQGVPDFLGSDVKFTKYEFIVDDMLRLGRAGELFYRASSGGFLNDPSTVRFIEYKWFRGGDYYLFTHPLYTYQSLPETFASPSVYLSGAAIHHFDGFLLNRIPLVNRLKLGVSVGCAFLSVPNENLLHVESFVGLERKVKLWDTPTRFGVHYLMQPTDAAPGFRWKVSIDVKDTFKDRWNY